MALEDKGSASGTYEDASAGKSGEPDAMSLAARRARLRNTLTKQALPPDPYSSDPFASAPVNPDPPATGGPVSVPDPWQEEVSGILPQESVAEVSSGAVVESAAEIEPEWEAPQANWGDLDSVVSEEFVLEEQSQEIVANIETKEPATQENSSKTASRKRSKAQSNVNREEAQEDTGGFGLPVPSDGADVDTLLTGGIPNFDGFPVLGGDEMRSLTATLESIDQQIGVFSVNMASMAEAAKEQLEIVRALSRVIQTQAFNEVSLSLNSLSDSISGALEPMKAVGELVPSIDGLVATLSSGGFLEPAAAKRQEAAEALTPEQLVMNLADLLVAGLIDPWTFKCAYMAVFPDENSADLLRKLVDLLGTQRLSPDLFRAAYDAVQAPDPPKPVYVSRNVGTGSGATDEVVLAQIEELRQFNEQMRLRFEQREGEFAELLAAKDQEVQENNEKLNSKWDEFTGRYEELSQIVSQRNEMILEKEAELSRKASEIQVKDSEINQLKVQLDELRDQTKDMVSDLQRQLIRQVVPEEKPKPVQSSFFESATPQPNLFTDSGNKALFNADPRNVAQTTASNPVVRDEPVLPSQSHSPLSQQETVPQQAIPRPQISPPTTPYAGAGSYGSGVRAQVFEVIVRQALAGAPWKEICAGPMQVNNISADEVEGEVKRRQALLGR
jgi:hypothetical protein